MARDISIAYSARDQISPALNSMRNSNKLFNKDLEETQQKIDNLNKRQDSLTEGLAKSRGKLDETASALRQAKKDYEQYGEILGKDYMSKFYQDHEEAKQQVKDFESAIKSTRKEINGLSDDMNRAGNRADSFGGTESGMMSSLAKAGLGKMIGDSLTGAVNVGIGSAFGSNFGDAISTTLSGALTGAAIGSIIPGIGTAIGAGVGLIAGGISAAAGYFEKEDDAYRSVRQGLVENALAEQAAGLERGIPIASSREGNLRRLDALGARNPDMLNDVLIEIGRTPPFSYDTAMELTSSMMGLGVSVTDAVSRINNLADAAAALNISESGISTIVTQLETAQMTGKVDTRVMRSLMRTGINPYLVS